ncbi:chaplin [Streptomyces sp. NPDC047525]|uniref:chaplin n=1 Tax=Streptomyces sp. NPDC047525 TaxID=3155264 RepID=UPI0033E00AC2
MLATAAATSILSLSGSNAFAAGGDAVAADSPGILSGNSVQAPLDVPVNACGNTADVVGAANPATGNSCANSGSASKEQHTSAPDRAATQERAATRTDDGGYGQSSDTDSYPGSQPGSQPGTHAGTQSLAESDARQSPGILSGNSLQAPLDVPVNACGNTADVVGVLNPVTGNSCSNGVPAPTPPQHETPPPAVVPPVEPPVERSVPRPVQHAAPPQQVASSVARQVSAPAAPHGHARLAETGSDQDLLAAAAASAALLVGGGILYRRGRASSGR